MVGITCFRLKAKWGDFCCLGREQFVTSLSQAVSVQSLDDHLSLVPCRAVLDVQRGLLVSWGGGTR